MPDPATASTLAWLERASLPVGQLNDSRIIRAALDGLCTRLDGSPAAANTITRTRAVFHGAPGYAVEPGLLAANPANRMQWRAPTAAVSVNPSTIASPAHGRGKMILTAACPRTGTAWTSTGRPHEARGPKHRSSTIRVVPMPPVLVAMLLQHLRESGTTPDRRLFRGARAGMLSESVYRHRHHSSITHPSPRAKASGYTHRRHLPRPCPLSVCNRPPRVQCRTTG